MSTFNTKETIMAGGKNLNFDRQLYRLSPEWELYTTVVNTLGLNGTFYESDNERLRRIRHLVGKCDHRFTAKLAVYARQQMNLRTVPLILLVELASVHRGDSLVSKAVERCIMRADEIPELLACYQWRNKKDNLKGMSAQLLRGLRTAFNRFDEYQFAKYSFCCRPEDKRKRITLRDALFLVHPKAKDEHQQEIFNRIANDELQPPYTWEHEKAELMNRHYGSYAERLDAERDMWEAMIDSGRLGYMALIRNLTRMYTLAISDEALTRLCEQIMDADSLRKSHMMPFRLFNAWYELSKYRDCWWCHRRGIYHAYRDYYSKDMLRYWLQIHRERIKHITKFWSHSKICYRIETPLSENEKALFRLRSEMNGIEHEERQTYTRHIRKRRWVMRPKTRHLKKVRHFLRMEENWWKRQENDFEHARRWIENDPDAVKVRKLLDAVNAAAEQATDQIKGFGKDTRVLIAAGMTPAMRFRTVSKDSKVSLMDIASHLAVSLAWKCDNVQFGRLTTKFTPFPLQKGTRLFDKMVEDNWELSASHEPLNGLGVLKWMISHRDVEDKVILFTDGQILFGPMFTEQWKKYKRLVNPHAKLYIFDLAGYGTTPIEAGDDDVYTIAGWNDSVFDILEKLEQGSNALKEIRDIKL